MARPYLQVCRLLVSSSSTGMQPGILQPWTDNCFRGNGAAVGGDSQHTYIILISYYYTTVRWSLLFSSADGTEVVLQGIDSVSYFVQCMDVCVRTSGQQLKLGKVELLPVGAARVPAGLLQGIEGGVFRHRLERAPHRRWH